MCMAGQTGKGLLSEDVISFLCRAMYSISVSTYLVESVRCTTCLYLPQSVTAKLPQLIDSNPPRSSETWDLALPRSFSRGKPQLCD